MTRSPAMSLRALAGARVPQRDGGSRIGLRRQSSRASPSLVAALASQSAAAWRLQLRDLARAAHGALHAWQLALALS